MAPHSDDLAAELFSPIDFMSKGCDRLKLICALMVVPKSGRKLNSDDVAKMLGALRNDFPLQFADEAQDLIPILQLRARPGDELVAVLRDLATLHAAAGQQLGLCAADLETLWKSNVSPASFQAMGEELSAVAAGLHRHLALVTAVVLPIARLRFTDGDLAALRQGLAARRGIALPHSQN
ncbi:hypothetical protein ABAC460_01930 [Asticcacaulis sp. AC460]|uniref:hypothetical protein n=1 Tax=Asticcacaulis sp. AC460 TaxID=1282360 RepID=UPI0003C3CF48|nr:hypothetical protein [Asticcacaulis sp. AC460]ESQ93037.1 hypothetical protein ABAC460_01930 [Asticcacaulis sp. AC460]